MNENVAGELKTICDKIRTEFDAIDAARERGLVLSREVIRNSANAIRSVHRGEFEEAQVLMNKNAELLKEVDRALKAHPRIYHAGFVKDAQKEHAEAHQTYALIHGDPLPDPDDLGVGTLGRAKLAGGSEMAGGEDLLQIAPRFHSLKSSLTILRGPPSRLVLQSRMGWISRSVSTLPSSTNLS